MEYLKIESVEQLKELAEDKQIQCFISLNGGLKSSKNISWHTGMDVFYLDNEIDGSQQELTEKMLYSESNIGEAINKGAFYKH